jgi:membrane protease YdiL (CAAX protease family)
MSETAAMAANPELAAAASRGLSRRSAALEIAVLLGGVIGIAWLSPLIPQPRQARIAMVVALVIFLVVCHLRERPDRRALGLRFDNFMLVLGRLAPAIVGFVGVVVAIGFAAGSLNLGSRFLSMLVGVPVWALLQHYLLLGFAHRRFRVLLGPGRPCILASTALFGLVHLPNPILTIVCTAGGFVWARQFERSPNLFAHALTHAIGSAFLANSLSRELLRNLVVGYRYFGG